MYPSHEAHVCAAGHMEDKQALSGKHELYITITSMPKNILKFRCLCYAVIQLCFRAQNETAGNSHFSEIVTSKESSG
jgi:hypothetical protein